MLFCAQDFDALVRYLNQFSPDQFLTAMSNFHLLVFLATCDMLPLRVSTVEYFFIKMSNVLLHTALIKIVNFLIGRLSKGDVFLREPLINNSLKRRFWDETKIIFLN